jgi:hypothetical protein
MKHLLRFFLVALLLTFFAAACSSPGGSESIDGNWSGFYVETYEGIGAFDVTAAIEENDGVLTGTAVVTGDTDYTVGGTVTGNNFTAVLTSVANPVYIITATGSYSGDSMSGTWEDNDVPQWGGTFSMER